MAQFTLDGLSIKGIASCVPANRADNRDIIGIAPEKLESLIQTTGIRYRRIAPPEICASDMCVASAEKLLQELGWNPDEIDALIIVSQTPDHTIPGTATQVQQRLGLKDSTLALDINQGCAGYVYGLSVIGGLMKSAGLKKGLLLVGDTITRTISKDDFSLVPIFSDAGSATAIELDGSGSDWHFETGSSGEDYDAIYIPEGGARHPAKGTANHLTMRGHAVYTFGLTTVAKSIKALMERVGANASNTDYLVFHQANQLLLDAIRKKAGFEPGQVPYSLHDYGNTSCATVPVTITSCLNAQLSEKETTLLLSGFGVGLSWANVWLTTNRICCPPMIEL